jgi:hypothetical protein
MGYRDSHSSLDGERFDFRLFATIRSDMSYPDHCPGKFLRERRAALRPPVCSDPSLTAGTIANYGWLEATYPFLPMQVPQLPLASLNMPLNHILPGEVTSIDVPV